MQRKFKHLCVNHRRRCALSVSLSLSSRHSCAGESVRSSRRWHQRTATVANNRTVARFSLLHATQAKVRTSQATFIATTTSARAFVSCAPMSSIPRKKKDRTVAVGTVPIGPTSGYSANGSAEHQTNRNRDRCLRRWAADGNAVQP